MDVVLFLVVYIICLAIMVLVELYLLLNNKGKYLIKSYKALELIFHTCDEINQYTITKEINRFYEEYVQEDAQIQKFFPNVVVWLDAIIFRINCENKRAVKLIEYVNLLKNVRDELEIQNPFNKCEKYQQDILHDINKIKTSENQIIVQNVLKRTEDEFIRLSSDIKKNERMNAISITIGIIGIVVSVIMAIINF